MIMKELIIRFMKEANKWWAECGDVPTLWRIGTEYHYARNAEEKTAWHVLIADILRRYPEYASYLPKLPKID